MTLNDIIALAKQGYKPTDIKELMALESNSNQEPPAATDNPAEEAPKKDEQNEPVNEQNEQELEYKKLLEEAQQKNAELQKKLEDSQHSNINQNLNDSDSPENVLSKFFES